MQKRSKESKSNTTKTGFFYKIKSGLKRFFGEYKQVKWPTPKTTINLAIFVIILSVIITLIILGLDAFFFELRSKFIIR